VTHCDPWNQIRLTFGGDLELFVAGIEDN
jgi:hypothetical protein